MISAWILRRRWALWPAVGAALVALAVLFVAGGAGASMPYNPLFELTGISSSATGANANITFHTSLPAGHHIIGAYGLEVPDNSWTIAGGLVGNVTVVGTMTINLEPDGNCNDGDSGSPQNYGPFALLGQNTGGGGGPHAIWAGRMTDFGDSNPGTNWDLTLTVEELGAGYAIDGFVTDAILPAGNTVCTPEVFTLTFCGRANPTSTATTCGSGANPILMTNPAAAGCYFWTLVTLDDSGQHSATPQAGVSIGGTPCPTPTATPTPAATATPTTTATATATATPVGDTDGDGVPNASDNCPTVYNPDQLNINADGLGDACDPDDYDLDQFSDRIEYFAGTHPGADCAATPTHNAWPADFNNDRNVTGADISLVAADIGNPVPPALARKDVAPDPPDGSITGSDLSAIAGRIGRNCGTADQDGDGVSDAGDNCPAIANPDQRNISPPDGVGDACDPDDFDLDAFSDRIEYFAGTDPGARCAVTTADNAWPPDFNNDRNVTGADLSLIAADIGNPVPPALARKDIAPDPPDRSITGSDLSAVAGRIGQTCTP